jgi:uncharacterized protein
VNLGAGYARETRALPSSGDDCCQSLLATKQRINLHIIFFTPCEEVTDVENFPTLETELASFNDEIREKIEKIEIQLSGQKILVAFSGGVDSTLACVLAREFGREVLAVTIDSPTIPGSERAQAANFAAQLGIPHRVVRMDVLTNESISENSSDRCYFCKRDILDALEAIARKDGFDLVIDGTNASDLGEDRAGLRALRESNTRSPLAEAGITKEEIIAITEALDLPSKGIPAQACLATRIPFGTKLEPELLQRIDEAEGFIRELLGDPTVPLRVRVHPLGQEGSLLARIEAGAKAIPKLAEACVEIEEKLSSLGFTFVTVDLGGFESGSMNRA